MQRFELDKSNIEAAHDGLRAAPPWCHRDAVDRGLSRDRQDRPGACGTRGHRQARGHFVGGKYDQLERGVPYAALIQAFRELMHQVLTEEEVVIGAWKNRLLQALGPNGQVIIDKIPERRWVMEP